MSRPFADRAEAGRILAEKLAAYRNRDDVIVLGLPRGGVPVAYEVAGALGAPLDVFVVRKLGAPGQEELAMGAIASGDVVVINVETGGYEMDADDVVASERASERFGSAPLYALRVGEPGLYRFGGLLPDRGRS